MSIPARQLQFVNEYAVDGNGAAAAVRAGYSARSARQIAHDLLTKHDIAEAVAARRAELASRLQITRERVVAGLAEAAAIAELKDDPAGMVAAYRELGKLLGYYQPETRRIEVSTEGAVLVHRLRTMSDAELLALATA